MTEVLAVLALAAASGLWVVVQRWARRVDPDDPGPTRSCGGCTVGPSLGGGEAPAGPAGSSAGVSGCHHGGACGIPLGGRPAPRGEASP